MSKYIFILILTILLFGNIYSKPTQINKFNPPIKSLEIDNDTYITSQNIFMFVTNHGSFGRDLSDIFGHDFGTWFPFTSIDDIINNTDSAAYRPIIFEAGVWLGGKVNGETRIAASVFSSEYVPGPMKNGTFQTDRAEFKVYKLYSDSLSENPNFDYLNWPINQGAPINPDSTPHMLGDQMTWSVFNDADPNKHTVFATQPLGIEVQHTVWTTIQDSNSINMKYKFINKGSSYISDMYFLLWVDPDLGGAGDDFVGTDSVNNLIYCYNGDDADVFFGNTPPAVGVKFVQGPLVPSPGGYGYFDETPIQGFRNLNMTAATNFQFNDDPSTAAHAYNTMLGVFWPTGRTIIDPTNNLPTTYMHSGDPISGVGWIDEAPAGRKMSGSSGPFNLAPGDSQFVKIKISAARGSSRLVSVYNLRNIINSSPQTCCIGIRGNMDNDLYDQIDVGDLIFLVDHIYASPLGPTPECFEEGDVNNDNSIDVSDLILLVDYMFNPGSTVPDYCE